MIARLLIANRGEIACRIIATARRMGIATVAVHSDCDAAALHVRAADAALPLGGDTPAETYLHIGKLIAAARASGAEAVHPGYGFLSENADFADAVLQAGLVWVGPPPAAMRALGSKAAARGVAQAHGIACLPGYHGEDQSDQRFAAEAERIGFPLMVKATAGGGGRGLRLVQAPQQLPEALRSARSEAATAFGSEALLIERALTAPRHVEIQVFADRHGHCIHLGERDCSVQRRHQKIIEEAPSPAVDAALRERMGAAAVALARAAGYEGAGTVEFLLEEGAFYLMEMNTRLQVEHPVTEMLSGLDLVEWQLRVALGEALPLAQHEVVLQGHAVEVRLCAEDELFHPQRGAVQRLQLPAGVRCDHALYEGWQVPPHYDSMLGKLIAHAPTRAEAIGRLAAALDRTVLLGLPSNRALLAACLRDPVFAAGAAQVPFLGERADLLRQSLLAAERPQREAAAQIAGMGGRPAGVLPCPFARPLRLRHRGEAFNLNLQPPTALPAGAVAVQVGTDRWHVQIGAVDLFLDDLSHQPAAGPAGSGAGTDVRAPFDGKVLAVHAVPGAPVRRGDTLVVLESMKLEHGLAAARDGVVRAVAVVAGQQAAAGQLLLALEAAEAP